MPNILLRPHAKADLVEIWDYIAEDSEARADAFIEVIDQKLQLIAERPNIGRLRDELATSLRSFPVGRYIIFYIPFEEGINVVRVLHGARDFEAVLRDVE
ncbi:type II toxin-antitoxin system RelE/ParE family toxin [Desulfobulbus alkaliphilus]|uniref:type II toxin-antitoxin system RelE/ParE family toxin n=1 Tax=Desulfobulbus alkaliphilus TaxID=869814 RepID=UPI001965A2E4|nr:type II toxin-antitoxin system RelE/ParE family toxin [Desulfobulbus alkaliphilus]MBM9538791.1 type II toxin-antitoxin system RelE/ParE family toxin [Desulfobulbus alkaliphilus]